MPYKLQTTLPAVNGGADYALLANKADFFPLENGKRISNTSAGIKLTLALQNMQLSQLTVKFDHDPIPNITNEQIQAALSQGKFLWVQIPDCDVSLFSGSNGGGIGMTAIGQTAKIVSLKE